MTKQKKRRHRLYMRGWRSVERNRQHEQWIKKLRLSLRDDPDGLRQVQKTELWARGRKRKSA